MKNKEAYECTLSIILEEENLELAEVKVEQVILNRSGKKAIRLDAWALDTRNRQINTEMQNDTEHDDVRKSTEQCEEVPGLQLEDGTTKIFLNMSSRNGSPELISLLQYMKETRIDNPEIKVTDKRIQKLDAIVNEVKQSEEWEAVQMSILKIGLEKGEEIGKEIGKEIGLEKGIKALIETCIELGVGREDVQDRIEQKFELTKEAAARFMEKYWTKHD